MRLALALCSTDGPFWPPVGGEFAHAALAFLKFHSLVANMPGPEEIRDQAMPLDPRIQTVNDPPAGGVPSSSQSSASKEPAAPPPLIADSSSAVPPSAPARWSSPARQVIAVLLSLCLGLFLADGIVSWVDDTLILLFNIHLLAGMRAILFFFAVLMALMIYALMGVTPAIPKRLFLPVTLFNPAAALLGIPFLIYFYGRVQQIAWVTSLCQVIVGLSVLHRVRGGLSFRWPLVPESRLQGRPFSWLNLGGFLLANVVVLLPAVVIYLFLCAGLAVNHFSDGFLALRPGGLTVQVRKYVRADGRTIQLVPMAHVGEPDFYRKLAQSFPADSIILMEGVTDDRNLLTNKISYKRMANSLGLAEQAKAFIPRRGRMVRADVDVEQFAPNTIDFLNLAMLVHSQGLNAANLMKLVQYPAPPGFEERLFDDILRKRNRRVLEEIRARLPESQYIIVPWGVAHMPEIAKEIQKSGFHLKESREYEVIRFASRREVEKGVGGLEGDMEPPE